MQKIEPFRIFFFPFQAASAEGVWCCTKKFNSIQEAGLTPTDSVFKTGEERSFIKKLRATVGLTEVTPRKDGT